MTRTKKCTICKQRHPLEHFSRNARSYDGLWCRCKGCDKVVRRAYYLRKKVERLAV